MSLKLESIELIKATYPKLVQNGVKITKRMYEILFTEYPQCEVLFSSAQNQPEKLAGAILAFVSHLEEIDAMAGVLEKVAQKHVASNVKAIHYPMVADALIKAMNEVIGPPIFNEEVTNAWVEAYMYLASHLMTIESGLYAQSYQHNLKSHSV